MLPTGKYGQQIVQCIFNKVLFLNNYLNVVTCIRFVESFFLDFCVGTCYFILNLIYLFGQY
jgi:hypothetical protein